MDSYRKKVKSGSTGEPLDEKAAQWHYFDRMNFLKTFKYSLDYKQHNNEVTVDL